ncbi:membrane protein [Desulfocarbo indianensis]|nr:membrane protein [Desulfocarbo indianensis]
MNLRSLIAGISLGILAGLWVMPGQAQEPSVDEIIHKANHMALYQGADGKGKVSLVITDKEGRIRNREFNMLRKNQDNVDQDQKYFAYFKAPADVRKMVFMVHKHAALEKDDDRWLYLPSLDLVKRIAAGDKRTSFVGSDFLYEDISGRSPVDDQHELIKTTDKFYVVKNIPKRPESVEFEYYVAYIDKATFIPFKMEFFKKDNRLYRLIEVLKTENISAKKNGKDVVYPTVTSSVARDLENGSSTAMIYSNIKYNVGLSDDLFTERYLRRPPRDVMR